MLLMFAEPSKAHEPVVQSSVPALFAALIFAGRGNPLASASQISRSPVEP
jgi:hypothetical protein